MSFSVPSQAKWLAINREQIQVFNLANFHLEKLTLTSMASGHLCLELTETIEWREFPAFAEEFTEMIGVQVSNKVESVYCHIWHLRFPACEIRLVYDDFPIMVTLESDTSQGDDILRSLSEQLSAQQ